MDVIQLTSGKIITVYERGIYHLQNSVVVIYFIYSDNVDERLSVNPYRMQTFDRHLTLLYKNGTISFETAMAAATSPTNFKRNLQFEGN